MVQPLLHVTGEMRKGFYPMYDASYVAPASCSSSGSGRFSSAPYCWGVITATFSTTTDPSFSRLVGPVGQGSPTPAPPLARR
ncbi:hypothetical protein ACFSHQ_27340 [Gemmobacter lanyuensis]